MTKKLSSTIILSICVNINNIISQNCSCCNPSKKNADQSGNSYDINSSDDFKTVDDTDEGINKSPSGNADMTKKISKYFTNANETNKSITYKKNNGIYVPKFCLNSKFPNKWNGGGNLQGKSSITAKIINVKKNIPEKK